MNQILYVQRADGNAMVLGMAKEERIFLRASAEEKDLLARAASTHGLSLSEFILERALEDAKDALLDQRIWQLTDEQYSAFLELVSSDDENRKRLEKLLERKTPWDN